MQHVELKSHKANITLLDWTSGGQRGTFCLKVLAICPKPNDPT